MSSCIEKRMILCILVVCAVLTGCNEPKVIGDYPTGKRISDNFGETTQEAEETGNIADEGDKDLNYVVVGNSGSEAYEVSAKKVGNEDEHYPVYEVLPKDFSDADLKEICEKIFDKDSISVILPMFLTQADFVDSRIKALTDRKETYEEKGEAIPGYIEKELTDLEDRSNSVNMGADYTIPYQNEVKWTDLTSFYLEQTDMDVEGRVCYVEGTIDGAYYRVCFTDFQNDLLFRIFKPDEYYDEPAEFYTLNTAEHLPFDPVSCVITEEDAKKLTEEFLGHMGIDGYAEIAVYPACIYGRTKDNGETPDEVMSGYVCYYGREVEGKTRPYNSYIDDNITFIPRYGNLLALSQYAKWGIYNPLEATKDSGVFRNGYEVLRVCVTKDGVQECFWNSPSDVGEVQTDQAELLDFTKADEKAREYLQYYHDFVEALNYWGAVKVDRVELGMARMTNDDGHYYMVPAWYYYLESDLAQVDERTAVCVNAIDGSIINVETGGNTVTY